MLRISSSYAVAVALIVTMACGGGDDDDDDDRGDTPVIAETTLTGATAGTGFSVTFSATGTTPITWSVVGTLPPGMALDSGTGLYAGIPTTPGSFDFSITATNTAGADTLALTHTVVAPAPDATLLLADNQIVRIATSYPAAADAPSALTGVVLGDTLVSIDRRPVNGVLYALGINAAAKTAQLYALHVATKVATPVGAASSLTEDGNPLTFGTTFGIDFNPVADRLRVVDNSGHNFRMNASTGAIVDGDPDAGVNPDAALNGSSTTAQETAYTNSAVNAGVTTQYTLDDTSDALYIQNPPNGGVLTNAIALSIEVDAVLGFDIGPNVVATTANEAVSSGSGVVVVRLAGQTGAVVAELNLVDGVLSKIVPLAAMDVLGLALDAPSSPSAIGLSSDGANLVRFSIATPADTRTASVTGVNAGEELVGVAYRHATGQLFGLGVDASADTATLYLIEPQSGAATGVGTAGQITFLTNDVNVIDLPTTGYALSFNPTVDRLRVVTNSGLNFRVNPLSGAPIDGSSEGAGVNPDAAINGLPAGSTGVSGIAYTNDAGDAAYVIYTLDTVSNGLFIQNPANNGVQQSVGTVTVAGSALDFTLVGGLYIAPNVRTETIGAPVTNGSALAALLVGGLMHLYTIDLPTGLATAGPEIPIIRGLAVARIAE